MSCYYRIYRADLESDGLRLGSKPGAAIVTRRGRVIFGAAEYDAAYRRAGITRWDTMAR